MGQLKEVLEAEYKRNMNHSYLVVKKDGDEEDYQMVMVLENKIPGLLEVEARGVEGNRDLYYDISSLQPLDRLYSHAPITTEDMRVILEGILKVYESVQEYLLDEKHVLIDPEGIYMNVETKEIQMVFHPFYERDISESFPELGEYFLEKIDHEDAGAVMMAYQFYKMSREDNFVLGEVKELLEKEQTRAVRVLGNTERDVFETEYDDPCVIDEKRADDTHPDIGGYVLDVKTDIIHKANVFHKSPGVFRRAESNPSGIGENGSSRIGMMLMILAAIALVVFLMTDPIPGWHIPGIGKAMILAIVVGVFAAIRTAGKKKKGEDTIDSKTIICEAEDLWKDMEITPHTQP